MPRWRAFADRLETRRGTRDPSAAMSRDLGEEQQLARDPVVSDLFIIDNQGD